MEKKAATGQSDEGQRQAEAKPPNRSKPLAETVFGVKAQYVFVVLLVILVAPSAFFIGASYIQLESILTEINKDVDSKAAAALDDGPADLSFELFRMRAKVALEHDVMRHRHARSAALLATRTWMRFMSLMFGAILIVIGSAFVLGRITSPSSEGKITLKEFGVAIASSSPGVMLIALGVVLVAIPNLSSQTIQIDDTSTYVDKLDSSPGLHSMQLSPDADAHMKETIRKLLPESDSPTPGEKEERNNGAPK